MTRYRVLAADLLLLAVVATGCTMPSAQSSGRADAQPAATKRITASILGEIVGVGFAEVEQPPGKLELEQLLNAGLTVLDPKGARQPRLTEAVPNAENGLWKVFPDGTMETTWHIRPNVLWQDGVPFTADDLVFMTTMERDPNTDIRGNLTYENISRVEAPDPYTVKVSWSRPYLYADTAFTVGEAAPSSGVGTPRPKHLLEKPYTENKTSLTTLAFWNEAFVGTGPYRLKEWVRGSHVLLTANDQYALGRPKVDEIEVRFIANANGIVAGLLAGAVDVTISRGLSLDDGLTLRDQWSGQPLLSSANPIVMFPQLMPPAPRPMGDARFRRALLFAADRQQLVDGIMHGLSSVAHAPYLLPDSAEYAAVEGRIVRYDYDPRMAAQLLAEVGLTKGSEGFYQDASGQKPTVEIDTTDTNVTQPQIMLAMADSWQRAGVSTNPVTMSTTQLLRNREYLTTRPAFYLARRLIQPNQWSSSAIPLPENNYTGDNNLSRYANPDLDALIERYDVTIPQAEHLRLLGQIIHLLTDQVVLFGTVYDVSVTAAAKRLKNVTARGPIVGETWNAHEWDLT